MSVALTYPGIYLVESADIPRSVTPASTSLTAFIGAFQKGPVGEATLVTTWSEFAAQFGTTMPTSLATYAVWQFFLNGGTGAWIVRIVPPSPSSPPSSPPALPGPAAASGTLGPFAVQASSVGAWANGIVVEIEPYSAPGSDAALATMFVRSSSAKSATALETLTNLRAHGQDPTVLDLQALAAAITAQSSYVAASLQSPPSFGVWSSPPSGPGPAAFIGSPPAGTLTVLQNGVDGTFDAQSFADAVEAVLDAPGPLDQIAPDVFNIMCIPDAAWLPQDNMWALYQQAHDYCAERQAFLIVDPPPPPAASAQEISGATPQSPVGVKGTSSLIGQLTNILGPDYIAGAVYYPWFQITDPVTQAQLYAPPSGTIAGLYAATDASRGVWKAPAGVAVGLQGVSQLADQTLNDTLNGQLNVAGVNCLRTFPVYGSVIWGARTLAGNDLVDSPWKYVSVRRLTDFIEQSLVQSLRWAVFEPNGPALWSSIALEASSFMSGLYGQGAFSGATAAQAYAVACDASTTSPADMLAGVVNIQIGFQPVEPAEFVVLNIAITSAPSAG